MSHTLARQDNGQFQITFTIDQSEIKTAYDSVLAKMAETVEIEGFRKGKAPLDKVEAKIGKPAVYDQVVHEVLPKKWLESIEEYKLIPIINPQVRIISANPDSDWQFEATSCEMPKLEISDAINKTKGLLKGEQIWTPDQGEENKQKELSEEDQLVKIFDVLLANVTGEIPQILVNQESDRMLSELLDQIQKLGLTLESYLQSLGKTSAQIRESYIKQATEQLKLEFVLAEISRIEKITVDPSEVDAMIQSTPDAGLKEAWSKPENRRQLEYSLIKRKTVDHLLNLAKN